jgi:hypothetical protein
MTEVTLEAVYDELREARKELKVMTEFVNNLQAVLAEMSSNPMLKAFGIGGLEGLVASDMEMPTLPGMPTR